MKRKVTEQLLSWKSKTTRRMPLILNGARQVGKTYSLRDFGSTYYPDVAYFNLETNLAVSSYFNENIEPDQILRYLEVESGKRIIPGETLIILDEIQTSERALTSLKYFNEQMPEHHIACAGSLLGVAMNREKYSFPVGNVDSISMYPLDFEEFLWSLNQELLCDQIRQSFDTDKALPAALHQRALDYYRLYLIIGGMPMVIQEYLDTTSLIGIPDIQRRVINDYIADMAKYATNVESVRIRATFDSLPVQLAKENKKFQYKLIQRGGSASIFGTAIDWLAFASIVLKCSRIEHALIPISAYRDLSSFKLYMADVGLLSMASGIPQQTVLAAGEAGNTFLGALTENYVAQEFTAKHYDLFYWKDRGESELDFLLQKEDRIIPVEVKTGSRIKSRSLSVFIEKYQPDYSIRISSKNFGFENKIKSVPLYAVFCI